MHSVTNICTGITLVSPSPVSAAEQSEPCQGLALGLSTPTTPETLVTLWLVPLHQQQQNLGPYRAPAEKENGQKELYSSFLVRMENLLVKMEFVSGKWAKFLKEVSHK
jgi:hypothetical protein